MKDGEAELTLSAITLRRAGNYTPEDVLAALNRVKQGEKYAAVARLTKVPLRTLFKKAADLRNGKSLIGMRRGTKPLLPMELEADLVEWVAAMQRVGVPVCPSGILAKTNEVYLATQPMATRHTSPPKPLTTGWYRRFLGRHSVLAPRIAQQIARVRNRLEAEAVMGLFYTMARFVIEKRLDATRIFNMDETSFMPKTSTRKVVAVKGSTNVWTQEAKPNFHMTVVAAVSAAGSAVPPLIILPGKRIYPDEVATLSIDNASVTGAPKGFSNSGVFRLWLKFFDAHLTRQEVQRPVVLVLNNSSTHLGIGEVSECLERGILLVALPPNATHLYQPLDVAVFKLFKAMVRAAVHAKLLVRSSCTISKTDAIAIACNAYRAALIKRPSNAVNGFQATGLYPPSLVSMQGRLRLFASGGARGDVGKAEWLKRKREIQSEVRNNILLLRPAPGSQGKRRRVTLDFEGCLITNEILQQGYM